MDGDGKEVPLSLRMRHSGALFVCFAIGISARAAVLVAGAGSLLLVRSHPLFLLPVAVLSFALLFADAQWTAGHNAPDGGLAAAVARMLDLLLYLFVVSLYSLALVLILFAADWMLEHRAAHVMPNAAMLVLAVICVLFLWAGAQDIDTPIHALTLRKVLR